MTSLDSVPSLLFLLQAKFSRKRAVLLTASNKKLQIWSEDLEVVKSKVYSSFCEVYCATQLFDKRFALGLDSEVHIINDKTLDQERTLVGDAKSVWTIAQLRNGKLVFGGDGGNIFLWNLRTMKCECTFSLGNNANIRKLIELQDGRLAVSTFTNCIEILEIRGSDILKTNLFKPLVNSGYIRAMYQIDENILITGGDDSRITIYDVRNLNVLKEVLALSSVRNFVPFQGKLLYSGSSGVVYTIDENVDNRRLLFSQLQSVVGCCVTTKYIVLGIHNDVLFYDFNGNFVRAAGNHSGFVRVTLPI